ncbi:MAG TPA: hypothetical protein PKC03_06495 [Dokdonella sp.]|nr:hypothetical protein [Dokdonella sp.]
MLSRFVLSTVLLMPLVSMAGSEPERPPIPGRPHGTTATVTVGSDGACGFSSITLAAQWALTADQLDIRVAKNVVITGPQLVPARNVAIYGGYDTCSDPTPSGRTILDGSGFTGSPLRATGSYAGSTIYTLRISALEITGGTGVPSAPGGAVTIDGPFWVLVENSSIHDNNAPDRGGGIWILGQPGTAGSLERTGLFIYGGSSISNNQAGAGGGIACEGRVIMTVDNSLIAGNDATASFSGGGGIYSEGCYMWLGDHSTATAQGVIANRALASGGVGYGGGISAWAGSTLYVVGGRQQPSIVALNSAERGGGIFLADSALIARNATINNNTAGVQGGGVYAVNSDTRILRTLRGANCHETLRCSQLSGNRVTGTDFLDSGGGLRALHGTTLISGTFIELNHVSSSRGMAISVGEAPGTGAGLNRDGLQIFGSVIANNDANGAAIASDASIVWMTASSALLGFNTFARNVGVPRIVYSPSYGGSAMYPIGIVGSIFDSSTGLSADPGSRGTVPSGDCNRLNESGSAFAAGSLRSTTVQPQFVDAANRDFSLAATSPMVDWCDESEGSVLLGADGGPRPYDDPFWTALYGNYDLGGLERHPDDLIFRDDFES